MRRIRQVRAFRGKRRKKYTWLPTLGGQDNAGDNFYDTNYFASEIEVNTSTQALSNGGNDIYVTPLVPDKTFFGLTADESEATMRDLTEGQDWLLKRIVGNLCIAVGQVVPDMGQTTPKIFKIAAGFFVASGITDIPNTPWTEWDPLSTKNVRQPWIWRRNWCLMNGLSEPSQSTPGPILEVNNQQNDGGTNGQTLDSKVARRIRREERLFFVLQAYGYDDLGGRQPSSYSTPGVVQFNLDYRVLGAMRRSNNKSVF